ncbi:hypothetical protein LC653_32335 [Nostoc sp. CHAB 5784]|uniref:hypothetical protein n=1 Tax=Nostoc mirabile TaxID=2907820 RepID=UPI001E5AA103|nr:hypothetical protein [Nostoc mirabile]MCC5668416.1 hypothetical protein [Nostoc mirabile CHAB5784]
MYNNIADINREIAALREERDCLILYWFEMGEADRDFDLPLQYPDNAWYTLGWHDRDYQLEIGFISETPSFDHF